jgi:uncharacterized membrane protein YhaH (DUF805 family)
MDWVGLFTKFDGRISRKPFWIGMLILAAFEVAIQLASDSFDSERMGVVLDLIVTYPEFAVLVKRAHDRNISTWVVGTFIALSVAVDLFALAGYGLNRVTQPILFYLVIVPLGLFALVLLVDLGFRRGTEGDNRYGPDPLLAKP